MKREKLFHEFFLSHTWNEAIWVFFLLFMSFSTALSRAPPVFRVGYKFFNRSDDDKTCAFNEIRNKCGIGVCVRASE